MDGDVSRTAFELSCVLQRRDSSEVTAVAVDIEGFRLYVGLDNGMLEEYKLLFVQGNEVARVSARRSVSKKSIKGLCQTGNGNCLSILIEDGTVFLCDMDNLDPKPLPGVKNAVAIASDTMSSSPCVLAVAIPARLSTKKTSIDIYEINVDGLAEAAPPAQLTQQFTVSEEVKALKWMNGQILFCTKQAYKSINQNNVSEFLKPSCVPMLATIPAAGVVALLWEDTLAVVADTNGAAARPPLNVPSRPIILSQGGMCVVAGKKDQSTDVYDLTSGDSSSGSCVILATSRRIWVLRPVAPETQALQLLKAKSYDSALDLAGQCDRAEAPWVGTCYAQAGLLLIQDLRWQSGVEALANCSPSEFQPCELFPLFPEWTSADTHKIPKKQYWGLHTELVDVPTMVKRFGIRRQMSINEIEPATTWQPENVDAEASTSRKEEHMLEARQWVASYLIQVRGREGVICLEGIDTLIVHLLASTGDAGRLESFLSAPQHAKLEEVRSFLLTSSRPHALALLLSARGDCSGALDIWQKMDASEISESPSTAGAVVEAGSDNARVAKYFAARMLLDEEEVSDELAVHHLKWLRDSSPYRFIQVIKMRKISISKVLEILEGQHLDLQWRYLEHLIHSNLTQDSSHHTMHAHVLIKSICESHHDIEDVSISPDKGDGWGLEASTALLRTSSAKREIGTALGRYRLEPECELGEPPECYEDPESLVNPSRADLRLALQSHLVRSRFYNARDVLRAVEGTWLYEEQVILYCRQLDHPKALRVLAVTLNDINSAIRYCKKHARHEGFISLLEMLLRPGEGREPMYTEACQVLNAESGNLDPMRVLEALSEDMPLSIAYSTLSRMLRERIHRKRQTGIVHQLYRSREVLSRSEQYELQSTSRGRVVVEPDSQCAKCGKLLGGRIFYRYPNHSLVCASCHRDLRDKESIRTRQSK